MCSSAEKISVELNSFCNRNMQSFINVKLYESAVPDKICGRENFALGIRQRRHEGNLNEWSWWCNILFVNGEIIRNKTLKSAFYFKFETFSFVNELEKIQTSWQHFPHYALDCSFEKRFTLCRRHFSEFSYAQVGSCVIEIMKILIDAITFLVQHEHHLQSISVLCLLNINLKLNRSQMVSMDATSSKSPVFRQNLRWIKNAFEHSHFRRILLILEKCCCVSHDEDFIFIASLKLSQQLVFYFFVHLQKQSLQVFIDFQSFRWMFWLATKV